MNTGPSQNAENPLGIQAIDHLEFTTSSLDSETSNLMVTLGLETTAQSATKELRSQGQVRFVANATQDPNDHAYQYRQAHGEGISKMAFLVDNAEYALNEAVKRGATNIGDLTYEETSSGKITRGIIKGFGDVLNEFVQRPRDVFSADMTSCPPQGRPLKQRVARIDHLTNNVPKGEMDHWVDFYKRIYGFAETRYFDIKGEKTGLKSKVVQLVNGNVIIPINEPDAENGKSQIQEFLDLHKGAGVQHIALTTADIVTTISELQERGMNFLETPDTYYEQLAGRGLHPTENLDDLRKNSILVDGDEEGYLLQIFTKTYVGPLFFEYIQRKGHNGFGEGNFQALFDAIEADQVQRGYLDA